MIPIPRGFTTARASLDRLTLVPPEGEVLAYQERLRPLVRLGAIVRRQLAGLTAFTPGSHGEPERLTTHEGEHAALVEIGGSESGERTHRFFGVTFGDDFYALLSAVSRPAARERTRDLVRALVLDDALGLGVRRRRYEYAAPTDWEPMAAGLATEWFAPGYPDDDAVLTAHAAGVRCFAPGQIFDLELERLVGAGWSVASRGKPAAFSAPSGLRGQMFSATLARVGRERKLGKRVVVLEDARYSYVLDLAVTAGPRPNELDRHAEALRAVAETIQPIAPHVPQWVGLGR